MKKQLLILATTLTSLLAVGQTSTEYQFLKQVLTANKVEITTNDITKTLTDPSYWKALAVYKSGEVSTPSVNNGFWFGKDGLYLESSTFLKLYGAVVDQEINAGIWNYDKQKRILTIDFSDEKNVYKVITLNAVELVVEDVSGTRYFFSAQTNLRNAPYVLQRKVQNNFLTASELKEQWVSEKNAEKERLSTIVYCEDFSEGLAVAGYDTEHKSDETNYGYGKKLFGYINEKGEYVIKPRYEKAFPFSDGFALVTTNTRYTNNWEFINTKGDNVFDKPFADARSFSEGLAAIRISNGSYGFIDKAGNIVVKPQYEEVGDFKEGIARVKLQDKWGYIDKIGNEIVIPQFYQAYDFSEGLAMVSQTVNYRKQYSYIDKSGKTAIRLNEGDAPVFSDNYYTGFGMGGLDKDKIEFPFSNFHGGLAMIYSDKIGNYFIDNTGKAILKPKNGNWNCHRFIVYAFINEFAISELCGKYGYLDTKGKWAVKAMFDNVGNFHDGLARVQINKNWGFIDVSGNVVINKDILKPQTDIQTSAPFDEASDFSEGFAIVRTRKKLGYIDKAGNWAFPLEIGAARPFKNGMARVKLMNRKGWNFIDKNGNILFPNFL